LLDFQYGITYVTEKLQMLTIIVQKFKKTRLKSQKRAGTQILKGSVILKKKLHFKSFLL